MNDITELIKLLSKNNSQNKNENSPQIPKEVLDQYPYGDFPIRYTKNGQETIRKNSESRFSYTQPTHNEDKINNDFDLSTILTLSTLFSGKKKQPKDMLELFSSILFKDKPELKKILGLFSKNTPPKEIQDCESFPDTNKVCISGLRRVE